MRKVMAATVFGRLPPSIHCHSIMSNEFKISISRNWLSPNALPRERWLSTTTVTSIHSQHLLLHKATSTFEKQMMLAYAISSEQIISSKYYRNLPASSTHKLQHDTTTNLRHVHYAQAISLTHNRCNQITNITCLIQMGPLLHNIFLQQYNIWPRITGSLYTIALACNHTAFADTCYNNRKLAPYTHIGTNAVKRRYGILMTKKVMVVPWEALATSHFLAMAYDDSSQPSHLPP